MEKWDAYDAMGRLTGEVLVRDEPIPEGLYHLVAHIWYRNKKGELLVQRRALSRPLAPGLWASRRERISFISLRLVRPSTGQGFFITGNS